MSLSLMRCLFDIRTEDSKPFHTVFFQCVFVFSKFVSVRSRFWLKWSDCFCPCPSLLLRDSAIPIFLIVEIVIDLVP